MADYFAQLRSKIEQVEMGLSALFRKAEGMQQVITDAMAYSLFAGGKRIRPVLTLAWCELMGGDAARAMPAAVAVEMIHTYSLIHDDLPCMDDDDLRRGRPTNHKVFGEANALLAGDALLTEAFSVLAGADMPAADVLRCVRLASDYAGVFGMIGGQAIDLACEETQPDAQTLTNLHLLKTGALMACAAEMGAIAGGGSDADRANARNFAKHLGLAFQIKDDILDVEGDEAVFGKPVGSDAASHKATYVSLHGLEASRQALAQYTKQAVSVLSVYGDRAGFLAWLAEYLLTREK